MKPRKIICTVTTDLNTDQRMIRICSSLAGAGYEVTLVGRNYPSSSALLPRPYRQERLNCRHHTGKAFYLEYQYRLWQFLLSRPADILCAVDLDTILPVWRISRKRDLARVYDAHEWFSEMKEVVTRPAVHAVWKRVERSMIPRFPLGYTVSEGIRDAFRQLYGVDYALIRNVPYLEPEVTLDKEPYLIYQGSVNEARGLEYLIPAMKDIHLPLLIYGEGNLMETCRQLITTHGLENQVRLKGRLSPEALAQVTRKALIGINLFENTGRNNYLSLANKYFDYIQQAVPQLTMDFPEYRRLQQQWPVAVLIPDLDPGRIREALNKMIGDRVLYAQLQQQCLLAREYLNWQQEEKILLAWYQQKFGA